MSQQEFILKKRFQNHYGLDLKASDLTRGEEFASLIKNAQYRKSGSIEKRKGYQGYGASLGGFGLFTYNRINPTTGVEEPVELNIGQNCYRRDLVTLSVSYSGSDPTALISIFFSTDSSTYRCQVLEGATIVLDEDLGLGIDETTPVTIDDLKLAIDALANFAASYTGDGTIPAAFLTLVRDHDLSSGGSSLAVTAGDWVEVNSPITNPFAGSETNKNEENFENVTSWQLNNVIYFANGYDETYKYDGKNLYRAGVPTPDQVTSALGGAGAVTGTNYYHKIQYIQIDAVGNVIDGNQSTVLTGLAPAAQSMNVTIPNVQASSGFNTNCAIVNGAQVLVTTITVDDGSGGAHTMKVGDTAFFYDSVSAAYIEREVTAVAATTITIAGAAVTVADNAVISNNLRIAVYRNKTSATTPTVFYLIEEIPNNSFAVNQVYNDNVADSGLGVLFDPPATDRSPPPKGKYISAFRNQLVIAGNIENPRTFYWSDVDGPEFFPNTGSNQSDIETKTGDIISGIYPNNELFAIFTRRSIDIISGDISSGNIRVDKLTTDLGCGAHATIQEVKGALYFWNDKGPYKMIGGQLPVDLGESPTGGGRIEPVLNQEGLSSDQIYRLKRAISINDRGNDRYLTFLPCESTSGGNRYANAFSQVFTYDVDRDAWLQWDNLNMAGGVTLTDDEMYWVEKRFSTVSSSVKNFTYRRLNLNDAFDYQDHDSPVDFQYAPQWDAMGEPSILKKYLALKLFSLEELANNDLDIEVDVETNYVKEVVVQNFSFEFPGGGYGVSAYGSSAYGDPAESQARHKLGEGPIKSIRFIFKNNEPQQNLIITGWEIEVAAPYKAKIKK